MTKPGDQSVLLVQSYVALPVQLVSSFHGVIAGRVEKVEVERIPSGTRRHGNDSLQ